MLKLASAALFAAVCMFGSAQAAAVSPAAPVLATQTLTTDSLAQVQIFRGRNNRNNRFRGNRFGGNRFGGRGGRDCRRNRNSCRRWDGRGRRPIGCVAFGPVFYCP